MPIALAAAMIVPAIAVPASAVAPASPGQRVAFEAGYRMNVDDGTDSVATLRIPRADSCDVADGSVTVQMFVLVGEEKIGAEFKLTCSGGFANYSGMRFLGGERYRIRDPIRAGDLITVKIEDGRPYTLVYVTSTRGWGGDGYAVESIDLDDGVLSVGVVGELTTADSAGGLATQRFRFVRADRHRLGYWHPEPFEDGCSSVTGLRHQLAFDTSFVC
jgi:hypothetical protein